MEILNNTKGVDSSKYAAKLYMEYNKIPYSKKKCKEIERREVRSLRNYIPNLKVIDKATGLKLGKFTLGIMRMYLNGEIYNEITNEINRTLPYLIAHYNEYDNNLMRISDGKILSANDLIELFSKQKNKDLVTDKEELSREKFIRDNTYKIIPINTFKEAKVYNKYTFHKSPWCITYIGNMFDTYGSYGVNQIYFCLKEGFEKLKPLKGSTCPLDKYGLSMISIIVGPDGDLLYSTCRWNHENGGNDNILTTKDISKLIGANFYDIFKPNNKFKKEVENLIERLKNGDEINNIRIDKFQNGYQRVELYRLCNIITPENKLISDKWYDYIEEFNDEYFIVEREYKYNIINLRGECVSNTWYDYTESYNTSEYKIVGLNNKFNYVKCDGTILCKMWFDYAHSFQNGVAPIKIGDKCNIINMNGEFLCDQWFDYISGEISNNFIIVGKGEKYTYLNIKGELVTDKWFDDAYKFQENCATVKLNGKYNFINTNFEYIIDTWFDEAYDFQNGFAVVNLDGKYNYINEKGIYLSDIWFDFADSFVNGYGRVGINWKHNFITPTGDFLLRDWVDYCANDIIEDDFNGEKILRYKNQGKWFFIKKNGELLTNQTFDDTSKFYRGYSSVCLNEKWNFININGELISDVWFDETSRYFYEGFASVCLNEKWNFINENGGILSDQWFDDVSNFYEGVADVYLNNNVYTINTEGELSSKVYQC